MCSTLIPNIVECQVEPEKIFISRFNGGESRTYQTGAFISDPIIPQGHLGESWPEKRDMNLDILMHKKKKKKKLGY